LPRKGHASRGFFDALVFEAFAVRHKHATLGQMQEAWEGEHGQKLSEKTFSKKTFSKKTFSKKTFSNWLGKLGWTRKKRVLSTPSATRTNDKPSSKS